MKKAFIKRFFHKSFIITLLFCLIFPAIIFASAIKNLSEKELVELADVILVGNIDKKEARWVGRRIETTLSVRAKEYWKGNLGDSFELTQMGGEVQRPLPIAMLAGGAPVFFEGEQVILFLEKPKKSPDAKTRASVHPSSKLPDSCQVVGWSQGKYTVIKDKNAKQDKIIRLGVEDMQILDRREMDKRVEAAMLYSGVSSKYKEKPVKSPKSRSPGPLTGKMHKKGAGAPSEPAATAAANMKSDNGEIPFDMDSLSILDLPKRENLDDFKKRIQGFLK